MAQAPPTAGVPSSSLGHSMWVSWWTKRGLGRFFSGFLPFSPTTNFIPPFLHTHLIHFSFHFICPCDGASGVVGRHPCYSRTYNIGGSIASPPTTRPCVGHELRLFLFLYKSLKDRRTSPRKVDMSSKSRTSGHPAQHYFKQ